MARRDLPAVADVIKGSPTYRDDSGRWRSVVAPLGTQAPPGGHRTRPGGGHVE